MISPMLLQKLFFILFLATTSVGFSEQNPHSVALSHIKLGQPQEALAILAPLLENDPKPQTLELQGRAKFHLNDLNGALAAFDQAISADPKRASTHYHVGEVFFQQKRWSEALGAFRYALELEPKNKAPILNLIYCLIAMENFPTAHKWITTLDPSNELDPDYYFARAAMAAATEKPQEYIDVLRQARTLYSTEVFNRYEPNLLHVVKVIRSRQKEQ